MSSWKERRQEARQRRALGLNAQTIGRIARELMEADEWTDDPQADSVLILKTFMEQNSELCKDVAASDVGFDFDQIIEWIEKLMPLIQLILTLFGL